MEIQNLISVFKNDSDNEESFDESISSKFSVNIYLASAVRITSLDQSMALFKKQGEGMHCSYIALEYKSSTDIKIEVVCLLP